MKIKTMKLKAIFEWIKKATHKPDKEERPIDKEDPYAIIKHKTKSLGFRLRAQHNNRKRTRGRNIQYVQVGDSTKPIYHGAR